MIDKENISELIYKKILSRKDDYVNSWNKPINTNIKHLIIDDILPEEISHEIYKSFPRNLEGFYKRASFRERKKNFC